MIPEEIYNQIPIIAQIKGEMIDFMNFLKDRDIQSVLEIGVADGGSISCWKGLFPDAYVLGIDIGTGSDLLFDMQKKFGFDLMMRSDSHDVETVKKLGDRRFDLIFIDGDHSYEGVKQDYQLYWPYVAEEGILAMHDIKDTEHHRNNNVFVGQFWNELKGSWSHSIKEFRDDSVDWGGIAAIFK